ncbi:MAG: DMT family transporter [Paracoccaceae bacterium]
MASPLRGILLKVLSVALFMAMTACIKATTEHVPPGEAVFFRSLFAIPPILGWLALRGELASGFRVSNPLAHLWRGLIGASAMALMFAAFGLLPLTEVVAITYAAPLFVTILAAMFLGEAIRLYRLAAVALGMAGVAIILSPRLSLDALAGATEGETLGAMLALFAAVMMALAQVFVRKLVRTETTSSIVFWFSLTTTGLSLLTLPLGWVVPSGWEAVLLVSAGLIGGVAQILITSAYRHAEVGVIAPFEYVSMIFALAIGYVLFDEVPTGVVLAGAALVATGGILIIWRERKLGLERAKARRAKGTAFG